jgi:hypothetical protein
LVDEAAGALSPELDAPDEPDEPDELDLLDELDESDAVDVPDDDPELSADELDLSDLSEALLSADFVSLFSPDFDESDSPLPFLA